MASSRLYTALQPMPAAAGQVCSKARPFAIATSNDPRGH